MRMNDKMTITITPNNSSPISVSWSNKDNLRKWASIQHYQSGLLKSYSHSIFEINFSLYIKSLWNSIEKINAFNNFPNNPIILDIGCGIGVIDLFLYQYLKGGNFFLIDKNILEEFKDSLYCRDYTFYNSWEPLWDGIETSGMHKENFNTLDPSDVWPNNIDLIMSNFSWCWHYPVDVYLDKVVSCLNPNGKLLLTIRYLDEIDVIEIISDKLKSKPIRIPYYKSQQLQKHDSIKYSDPKIYGGLCLWTNNIKSI